MKISDISDEMWSLLFGIRRSIRYHDRRVRFYDFLHTSGTATALIFGSAAVVGIISTHEYGKNVGIICAALVSIFAAFDLVFGFARKAWLHADLKRKFVVLETELIKNHSDDELGNYQSQRLLIEADEPPIMRALDILCHNELVQAEGIDDIKPLNFFKRHTASLLVWS